MRGRRVYKRGQPYVLTRDGEQIPRSELFVTSIEERPTSQLWIVEYDFINTYTIRSYWVEEEADEGYLESDTGRPSRRERNMAAYQRCEPNQRWGLRIPEIDYYTDP